jgi:hypothetical protein
MSEVIYKTTPVGRMVQGHPMLENTKNMKGGQLTDKQGNPRSEYFFAIAISKQDPGVNELIQLAQATAQQAFPQGQYNNPDFSWKIIDGDAPANREKEGFAGCWVFRCTNGWQPKCFTKDGEALIMDQSQLKRGYFIRASISFKGNDDLTKPGIFINCGAVELFSYGQEIQGGPDGAAIFGSTKPTYLPPGMTDAPVSNTPGINHGSPFTQQTSPFTQQTPPAQGGGSPFTQQTPAPVGLPLPNQPGNFLNPPPPTEPQPTPGYKMAPTAPGTYAEFLKAGWNDQQLIQAGHLILNDVPH